MTCRLSIKIVLCLSLILSAHSLFAQAGESDQAANSAVVSSGLDEYLGAVKLLKNRYQGASICLDKGRDFLFDLTANAEQKEMLGDQLNELRGSNDDFEKELLAIRLEQFKSSVIEYGLDNDEILSASLSGESARHLDRLYHYANAAIDIQRDNLNKCGQYLERGALLMRALSENEYQITSTRVNQLNDLIVNELKPLQDTIPMQISALEDFLASVSLLKGKEVYAAVRK